MSSWKQPSSSPQDAARPSACPRPTGDEVVVKRFGIGVLLLPLAAPWATMREALEEFEPGFTLQREQPTAQERDDLAAS